MRGWMPKNGSVQEIITEKMPEAWTEQEKWFFCEEEIKI
jgi:hypothetical protein